MKKVILFYVVFAILLWYGFYQWNEQLALAAVPPLDEAGLRRLLCGRGDVCAGVVVFPQYADPV